MNREVRQVDLFIVAVELLCAELKDNPLIKGIEFPNFDKPRYR
jgi:hypothetical protein